MIFDPWQLLLIHRTQSLFQWAFLPYMNKFLLLTKPLRVFLVAIIKRIEFGCVCIKVLVLNLINRVRSFIKFFVFESEL